MKVNFDFGLHGYHGIESTTEETKSYVLIANALNNPEFMEGSDIKKKDLALSIYREKEIEIDTADLELIKKALEFKGSGRFPMFMMTAIVRGQLQEFVLEWLSKNNVEKQK